MTHGQMQLQTKLYAETMMKSKILRKNIIKQFCAIAAETQFIYIWLSVKSEVKRLVQNFPSEGYHSFIRDAFTLLRMQSYTVIFGQNVADRCNAKCREMLSSLTHTKVTIYSFQRPNPALPTFLGQKPNQNILSTTRYIFFCNAD